MISARAFLASLVLILMLIPASSFGYTFHGDCQRTGNFSEANIIIPNLVWKKEISGLVGSSPIVFNGRVYVTNWFGWEEWQPGLYCLNASSGDIIWRIDEIDGASTPAIQDELLVIGNHSGELFFVDLETGTILKKLKLEESPSWWGIASSPLIYNNSIYVLTFSNGTLWKIDLNGSIVWKFVTGGEIMYYTSPSAYDGKIFFAGSSGSEHAIYCVDENGNLIWKYSVDSKITNSPSIGYGKVFFATKNNFYAVDLNGSLAWKINFNGTISTASLAYGKVFVGSSDGYLYSIDAENGEVNWKFKANGKIWSSPAVAGNAVYFATNVPEGTIYSLNLDDGSLLWYFKLKPPSGKYFNIMSSPFISDGKLYIGADSGYVYCFDSRGRISLNVTLYSGTLKINVSNKEYKVSSTSALSALYHVSCGSEYDGAEIGFSFELDDSWYETYGSFLLTSIFGVKNDLSSGRYWMYWVNDSMPSVGINKYYLKSGDRLYYTYGDLSSTPSNASIVLEIVVDLKGAGISEFTASSAERGGYVTSHVNVSVSESGWYVLVVSGTNENGEPIAGISVFYLEPNLELRVPVLIHVPQEVNTGEFKLYAGIYRLEEYPTSIIYLSNYIEVEVI